MKKILLVLFIAMLAVAANAQPQARRTQQQAKAQKSNVDNMTLRAQISYPAAQTMSEDVVWRRDIYRELKLSDAANSGLYYPEEPNGNEMNLFTYIFKLMLTGKIKVYEYRLDGNESFSDSARVKPLEFLDNYGIYYERNGKSMHLDNSDIPSRDVRGYYLKESAYYDQASATFHKKVIALCPIMVRQDDFSSGEGDDSGQKYPLFWLTHGPIATSLAKHTNMTSDLNHAATTSADDYFTKNRYKGKIYKTTNMLGKTLRQMAGDDDMKLTAEQKRIEAEIDAFEKNIFGNQARRDSLDSLSVADDSKNKKVRRSARKSTSARKTTTVRNTKTSAPKSSSSSTARVSARRERR